MTRYSLTIGTSSTHQWVQAIPGQIILVKQVNIHVYSIEVRYLSFMPIVKSFPRESLLAVPMRILFVYVSC